MFHLTTFRRAGLGVLGACLALCGAWPALAQVAPGAGGTTTTVIDNPGNGTNRIELSGNSAGTVQGGCTNGGTHVNSVNIQGQSLQGRTIIVQGRNAGDVRADADCAKGRRPAPVNNVNSVNIR